MQNLYIQKNVYGAAGNQTRDLLDDRRANHYTKEAVDKEIK